MFIVLGGGLSPPPPPPQQKSDNETILHLFLCHNVQTSAPLHY
jgi:hypothetical protein